MLLETIRQALYTMRLHRRWAALTMFGIVWGTASIVLLVGWGVGVQGMVEVGMQKVGKNLVFVIPGRVGEDLSPADERRVLTFDLDDVQAVRAATRYGELVGAEVFVGSNRPAVNGPENPSDHENGLAGMTCVANSCPSICGAVCAFFTSDASSKSAVDSTAVIAPRTRKRRTSARVSIPSMPGTPCSRR